MINNILQQQTCENIADYTDTQVPVTVELDLENSILEPGPEELQRFCYIVTQVDEPIALSHWLLGICPTITLEDIEEVIVTINGEPQTVIIDPDDPNVNVEIITVDNPDPTTGCIGLKFDFGLEEAGDVMTVCFELTTTYPIGPNVVCIKGGQVTENALSICGPICGEIEECEVTVFQNIGVCVPVTITPFAEVGPVNVACCGPANVSTTPCPIGASTSCTFYVRQSICAEVPVIISAEAESGETVVSCGELSKEVKIAAISALCKSKNEKYLYKLFELYQNEEIWEVRAAVAKGISYYKLNLIKDMLLKMIRDKEWWVRFNVARTISLMGEEGVYMLIDLSIDKSDENAAALAYYFLNSNKDIYETINRLEV